MHQVVTFIIKRLFTLAGCEKLDFDDRTLVRRARKTKEIKVKSRAALRRQNLIIFRDKLPPNTKYKLLLNVKNNAGSSKAAVLVESVSRPEKGKLRYLIAV